MRELVPVSHQTQNPIIIPIDASLAPPDHLVFAPFICGPTPQVANGVPFTTTGLVFHLKAMIF